MDRRGGICEKNLPRRIPRQAVRTGDQPRVMKAYRAMKMRETMTVRGLIWRHLPVSSRIRQWVMRPRAMPLAMA